MIKKKLLAATIVTSVTLSLGGVLAGAATLSPWAQKDANLFSNHVETTFTPSWLTNSDDAVYGVTSGKYIKNSWVKIVEGSTTVYKISDDYYKPSETWVHTEVEKFDNPLYTASMSYGWGYQ